MYQVVPHHHPSGISPHNETLHRPFGCSPHNAVDEKQYGEFAMPHDEYAQVYHRPPTPAKARQAHTKQVK